MLHPNFLLLYGFHQNPSKLVKGKQQSYFQSSRQALLHRPSSVQMGLHLRDGPMTIVKFREIRTILKSDDFTAI
jgi:hypothetical protein